jgi:hypothetical protein
MNWNKKQSIGFSVKSFEELKRICNLQKHGVNMVEVRVGTFTREGTPLYKYEKNKFSLNKKNLSELCTIAKGVTVQWHLPIEKNISLSSEEGFNLGVLSHHDIYKKRFCFLEEIYQYYDIGKIITMHPPAVVYNGKELIKEKVAIANAKKFFDTYDIFRQENNHQTIICVENMTDIKEVGGNVGYMPWHFKKMLKDTRTFGLTTDVGHRRLAKKFTVTEFMSLGLPIYDFHFHGNHGKIDPLTYDDDEHLLPNKDNVMGYRNYLRYFKRNRPAIVLEIAHLERYTDEQLINFLEKFREEIK